LIEVKAAIKLGIELDTIAIDNVLKIKNSLSEIRVRRKVTLRELIA
jgi:L-arabinose isomerase